MMAVARAWSSAQVQRSLVGRVDGDTVCCEDAESLFESQHQYWEDCWQVWPASPRDFLNDNGVRATLSGEDLTVPA